VGEDVEMVRSLVRSYMLGEQVDVAYCMTTLLAEVDRLRAELETVREAARACADSDVTTMGVFDDGEEEEMLIVPPNTLEALRLALSNKGGGDDG